MTSMSHSTTGRESSARNVFDDSAANTLVKHRRGDLNTAEALDHIGAALVRYEGTVTMPGQRLYTAPLTLPVFAVARAYEVPQTTPWQIRDGKNETTWHDLADVTDCELQGCEVRKAGPCVVLVSTAWSDGFAHMDDEGYVEVRSPAEVTR